MKSLLNEACDDMRVDVQRFPWAHRDAYADWLAQTYYYVRHSTRLLASAATRFSLDKRGDALHYRFAAHMAEERKHEQLALHDLKHIGRTIADIPERLATRMFYEPQYYKIEHQTPIALFGYILPLEAIGPLVGGSVVEQVCLAFGAQSASFLKLHAGEDVEHLEKAFQILESVTEHERALIQDNIRQTAFAYRLLLRDIRNDIDVVQPDR